MYVAWYGAFENICARGRRIDHLHVQRRLNRQLSTVIRKIACVIFGACLIYFGLAHHFYLANTVSMVPAWLPPGQTFWAYVTAAGHIAAGIAILSGICLRPAAMLLAAMFIVFAILVHAPRIIMDSHTHMSWAENAVNFALIGPAWVIAALGPAAGKAKS